MATPKEKGHISRLLVRLGAGIGGAVAIVVSTVASVYQVQTKPEIPQIAPGQAIEAGRWNIAVNSAIITVEGPNGLQLPDGKSALIIDISLENRTETTSNVFSETLELVNPPEGVEPQPLFFLKRDRAFLHSLHPRMPESVQVLWRLPPDFVRPETIDLKINAETFKPKDNLYAAPGWFNPHTVARVSLSVQEEAK